MSMDVQADRGEALGLKISAAAALALAALGIVWGLAAGSQVILFDGVYAIVGFVLSWFGLRAAALVAGGPTESYPFGREALAPLVVAAQALVLAGTFGYAALDAVGVILAGGSETEVGSALIYSVLSLLGSFVVLRLLMAKRAGSDLVAAEADQWRAGVVLGVALVIGFGVAVALQNTSWSHLAPFIDPVLVLVAAALILPTPVRMLRQAFRELLEGVPDGSVTEPIRSAVHEVRGQFGLPEPTIRIGKLGRKVYIELDFMVRADDGFTLDDSDRVRRALISALAQPGRLLWVNVELHTDPGWDT